MAAMTPDSPSAKSITTVGVLGDIHQEDQRLERALAHLRERSVDRILSVGDVADGPGDFVRCCQLLGEAGVEAVRGNHDRWLLDGTMRDLSDALPVDELQPAERAFLEGLPIVREYHTPAGLLLLCHGLGMHDMQGVGPDDRGYAIHYNSALQSLITDGRYRFVVNGHTHKRMVRSFSGLTIINAGTLFRRHGSGFAHIDFAAGLVTFLAFKGEGDDLAIVEDARHRL